jgi:CMP-N-acetylneuraminic acid synthetase
LGDRSLLSHAAAVGRAVSECVIVSSDIGIEDAQDDVRAACRMRFLQRPPELAQDDTPMIDVVTHAMTCIPGSSEDIWVLLQPTQPFRQPRHIQAAIALLQESGADSVVSVVELPRTHSPELACKITEDGHLTAFIDTSFEAGCDVYVFDRHGLASLPRRRQDAAPAFIRDGTVYAFRRATVEQHGNIYGSNVVPLLMAPEDTCELDTEDQWAEAVRRWEARI